MDPSASGAHVIPRRCFKPLPESGLVDPPGAGPGASPWRRGLWYGDRKQAIHHCDVFQVVPIGVRFWVSHGDVIHVAWPRKTPPGVKKKTVELFDDAVSWDEFSQRLQKMLPAGAAFEPVTRYRGLLNGHDVTATVCAGAVLELQRGPGAGLDGTVTGWSDLRCMLENVREVPMFRTSSATRKGLQQSIWEAAQVVGFHCAAGAAAIVRGSVVEWAGCEIPLSTPPVWLLSGEAGWTRKLTPRALCALGVAVVLRVLEWFQTTARTLDWYLKRFTTRQAPEFGHGIRVRTVQGEASRSCANVIADSLLSSSTPLMANVRASMDALSLPVWQPLALEVQ